MGSRITRSVFKNERATKIKKQQNEQVRQLIMPFIFLFGYLFRPYLNSKNSIGIYFIVLLLFVVIKASQVSKTAFLSGIALIVTMILSKIIKIDLMFLKASLILITTTFSSVINYELSLNPFYQAFLLWAEYQCFSIGKSLSLAVQKMNVQQNGENSSNEERMLVKILFSSIGLMAVMLISMGKRLLRIRDQSPKKQISLCNQIVHSCLCSIMLITAFIVKSQAEGQIVFKLKIIGVTLIILLVLSQTNQLKRIWVLASVLLFVTYILYFATQNDQSIRDWLNLSKTVVLNLILVDGIHKWISSINSGTQKPFTVVFIYFSAFYIVKLTSTGLQFYQSLAYKYLLDFTAFLAYGGLTLLCHLQKRKNYQQIQSGMIV